MPARPQRHPARLPSLPRASQQAGGGAPAAEAVGAGARQGVVRGASLERPRSGARPAGPFDPPPGQSVAPRTAQRRADLALEGARADAAWPRGLLACGFAALWRLLARHEVQEGDAAVRPSRAAHFTRSAHFTRCCNAALRRGCSLGGGGGGGAARGEPLGPHTGAHGGPAGEGPGLLEGGGGSCGNCCSPPARAWCRSSRCPVGRSKQ